MPTTYTAILSGTSSEQIARRVFPTVRYVDCVKWAEGYGQPAARCDIYREDGSRVAQYLRPKPGTYPAECGVWINAKIA